MALVDRNISHPINLTHLCRLVHDNFPMRYVVAAAFSRDGVAKTMISILPEFQRAMGQRVGPSFADFLVMNRFYGCEGENFFAIIKMKTCQNKNIL